MSRVHLELRQGELETGTDLQDKAECVSRQEAFGAPNDGQYGRCASAKVGSLSVGGGMWGAWHAALTGDLPKHKCCGNTVLHIDILKRMTRGGIDGRRDDFPEVPGGDSEARS